MPSKKQPSSSNGKRRWWGLRLLKKLFFFLMISLAYLGWIQYSYWAEPIRVERDYVSELNRELLIGAEEDFAWPKYQEILRDMPAFNEDWSQRARGWTGTSSIPRWESAWPDIDQYLNENAEFLQLIRETSQREILGFRLRAGLKRGGTALKDSEASSQKPVVVNVRMDAHIDLQKLALILDRHARLSFRNGKTQIAFDDLISMLNIASHVGQTKALFAQQLSANIASRSSYTLLELIGEDDGSISVDDLNNFLARLQNFQKKAIPISLSFARVMIKDFVQRVYTDNGNGDGHFRLTAYLDQIGYGRNPMMEIIFEALGSGRYARRKVTEETLEDLIAKAQNEVQLEPWNLKTNSTLVDDLEQLDSHKGKKLIVLTRLFPDVFGPYFMMQYFIQLKDSLRVVIALKQFKETHQVWPTKLSDLDNDWLQEIPPDRFDGHALRYKLLDGVPILYAIGPDQIDDEGEVFELDPAKLDVVHGWRNSIRNVAIYKNYLIPFGDLVLWTTQ
ncbi:hypothetical protein OAF56_00645 [Pirellulaceae bacterium]|nr:hypothetical protein [Pirellulaceae bacterium]